MTDVHSWPNLGCKFNFGTIHLNIGMYIIEEILFSKTKKDSEISALGLKIDFGCLSIFAKTIKFYFDFRIDILEKGNWTHRIVKPKKVGNINTLFFFSDA